MDKKVEKSFIIMNIIINIVTAIIILIVSYIMKNMEWWQLMLSLFVVMICSGIINAFNIVYHLRKK